MSTIGIYPGTFDPITNGHTDIIKRALTVVDELIIAVAADIPKTPIFSLKEREDMVENDIASLSHVRVESFNGLLVDFAKQHHASVIIRGLRAVSDFEYEFQLAAMNAKLQPGLETIFLPASETTHFIASRLVKEVARLGGDITPFVSPFVAERLQAFYQHAA